MSSSADDIATFCSVTGADASRATFFIDGAGGDVNTAISMFFEGGGGGGGSSAPPSPMHTDLTPSHPTPSAPSHVAPTVPSSTPSTSSRPATRRPAPAGGIRTLGDLGRESSDSDEDPDDPRGPQHYYAGGAKSGQQVVNPHRNRDADAGDGGAPNAARSIFDAARRAGAEQIEQPDRDDTAAKPFESAGYRLGNTNTPSMPDPSSAKPKPKGPFIVHIACYSKGFTVNEGPLRSFEDPANQAFLRDLQQGNIPRELASLPEVREAGGKMQCNLIDRSHEDYTPPKAQFVPFSGGGQALGSTAAAAAAPSSAPAAPAAAAPPKPDNVPLDMSAPTTSIQVRLADGTRLVAKFNHTHTVGHLYAFVSSARPGGQRFELQTAVPPVQKLLDHGKTLAEAGLLSSVVVQKPI